MTTPPMPKQSIRYVPLDVATTEPPDGTWDVYANRWWCHQPGKGLLFWRQSPQCNSNEQIARSTQQKLYPDAETIFIPRAYFKHHCE